MDPIELRLKNAAKKGTKTAYGVTFNTIGMIETLEAAKNSAHYKAPVKPGYARGVAAGFWFNVGAEFERHRPCRRGRLGHGDRRAIPTSAAAAPRSRSWRLKSWEWTTTRCGR